MAGEMQLPALPAPPAIEQTVGPLFQGLSTGLNTLVGTLVQAPAALLGNLTSFGQQAAQNIQVSSQQVLAAPLVAMQTTQAARGTAPSMPALPIPQMQAPTGQILSAQKGTPSGYLI